MSALENLKQMSSEDAMKKIAALNLPDYGVSGNSLMERVALAQTQCEEDGYEPGVAAALNNADVDGVLLEVLRQDPEKVFEGISALAYAFGTEKKLLFLPEDETELAASEEIRGLAEKYQTEVTADFLNVRACKGCAVMHIVTAANLTDALNGEYTPAVYVSVNGGELKKAAYGTRISELADLNGATAIQAGYRYLRPEDADLPVEEAGISNGVLRVLTAKECIVAETEKRLTASRKQSCGKCVFCREGLLQLQYMQKEITEGRGKAEFADLTKEIGEAMAYSTNCTMGEVSSEIALSAVNLFPDVYEAHIKKKKCDICFSAETVYIDPKLCNGCGECMDVCPLDCIEGRPKYIHMIDDMTCDKCGKCIEVCEEQAIVKTSGKVPKLPNRLTKVGRFKKH